MGSMRTNCSAVLHTAILKSAVLPRCGPRLELKVGRRAEGVRCIEMAERRSVLILGFGVIEAGRIDGQGEQKVEEWGRRHTADDICAGKDRKLFP